MLLYRTGNRGRYAAITNLAVTAGQDLAIDATKYVNTNNINSAALYYENGTALTRRTHYSVSTGNSSCLITINASAFTAPIVVVIN